VNVPAHPLLEGLLGRPTGRTGGCKCPGEPHTPWDAPWRDSQREAAKTKLFKYVRNTPEGTPLVKIVRDVFGDESGNYPDSDYQLARRFFERHDMFLIARRGGNMWVEPTPDVFHLNRSKHPAKTQDGDGADALTGESRERYARERAESYLSKHTMFDADSTRADMLDELATELGSIADRWNLFERVRGTSGPEYLAVPYTTRFNTLGKASDIRDGFTDALDRAVGEHDRAALVSVTTDPKLPGNDSALDAVDSLIETKNRFMSWLSSTPKAPQIDSRPDNLYVLEWTDSGLPHLHILLFGVNWVASQETLSNYLGQKQGRVVDVRPVRKRDDQWLIRDGASRVSARQYLGESMRLLCDLASMNPGDVRDAVDQRRAGDRSGELWKLALYWASGKQFWDGTPGLKDPQTPDEGLPHITRYRFIGTARYDHIPAHVRQRARFFTGNSGLPPPDAAGSPGTAPAD
jgi:hypothetical protein